MEHRRIIVLGGPELADIRAGDDIQLRRVCGPVPCRDPDGLPARVVLNNCIAPEEVRIIFQVRQLVALLLIIGLGDVEDNEGFQKPDLFSALGFLAVLIGLRVGLHGPACVDNPCAVLAELDL